MKHYLSLALMLSAFFVAGCSGSGEGTPDAAAPSGDTAPEKPVIALVMKSLANEFFKTMRERCQGPPGGERGEV